MLGHVNRAQQPMVAAAIRGIFHADSHDEARATLSEVVERLAGPAPKVARLLEAAEPDLLAFYRFPPEHRSKLPSTNRWNATTARSPRPSDVVAMFPNDAALIPPRRRPPRRANDEWLSADANSPPSPSPSCSRRQGRTTEISLKNIDKKGSQLPAAA